jgi:hypothetical protein
MFFDLTPSAGPIDLAFLPHPAFLEHRQQHNPSTRCDPVCEPHRSTLQVKPQLPQLAI